MMFTAAASMFTVAAARCKLYAYNDATHVGSELHAQIRAGPHGHVGAKGPRNAKSAALMVAKHGIWAATGALTEWR